MNLGFSNRRRKENDGFEAKVSSPRSYFGEFRPLLRSETNGVCWLNHFPFDQRHITRAIRHLRRVYAVISFVDSLCMRFKHKTRNIYDKFLYRIIFIAYSIYLGTGIDCSSYAATGQSSLLLFEKLRVKYVSWNLHRGNRKIPCAYSPDSLPAARSSTRAQLNRLSRRKVVKRDSRIIDRMQPLSRRNLSLLYYRRKLRIFFSFEFYYFYFYSFHHSFLICHFVLRRFLSLLYVLYSR